MTSIALTIAGSDSGGGAGIQADLKAFSALGVFGTSAITAITAQNTVSVTAIEGISPKTITAQIDAVFDDMSVGAVKIGMLGTPETIQTVADALRGRDVPVVLDPVMIAKSGDALLEEDATDALRQLLLPLAKVLTPNLPEAARLLDLSPVSLPTEMLHQAQALRNLGPDYVLMKGGHAEGQVCTDILLGPDGALSEFSAPRIATRNTHGTGCTLSAAIAAGLAKGQPVEEAVRSAHAYLHRAILAADNLGVGQGHGPVHHFHGIWPS